MVARGTDERERRLAVIERAISYDSGDVNVSGSSATARPAVAATARTYAGRCTRRSSASVAGRGAAVRPPRSSQRAATASKTCARSGRSGWPGGVVCSSKRGVVMSSMRSSARADRAAGISLS